MTLNTFIDGVFEGIEDCEICDAFTFHEKVVIGHTASTLFDNSGDETGFIPWDSTFQDLQTDFLVCPTDWSAYNILNKFLNDQEDLSKDKKESDETCGVCIELTSPTVLEALRDLNNRLQKCEKRLEALEKRDDEDEGGGKRRKL
eukprot:symbB.v1.2.017432.t1/scaffold1360.1/size203234/3